MKGKRVSFLKVKKDQEKSSIFFQKNKSLSLPLLPAADGAAADAEPFAALAAARVAGDEGGGRGEQGGAEGGEEEELFFFWFEVC
jgi:hypothetical protein